MTFHQTLVDRRIQQITDKWVAILGGGFHPDVHGVDYEPKLLAPVVADYERDMNSLFRLTRDPHAAAIAAFERAGLTLGGQ